MSSEDRRASPTRPTRTPEDAQAEWLPRVLEMLRALQFGSVEIVVHDGRVVSIERREKSRLIG